MFIPPIWLEARVPGELQALGRDPVVAGVGVPHGAGEPVVLIPGYLAGDPSLATMTRWLRRLGYRTARAGIRSNVDCTTASVDRLERRVQDVAERYGRSVALVGQSRGGTFAAALAQRRPDLVRGLVTLGSPLVDPLAVHPLVRINIAVVGLLGTLGVPGLLSHSCLNGDCCAALRERSSAPMPDGMPFVSVYSKTDGIVDWSSCQHPDAEHVEVDASHCGMGVNPEVYRAVARALASFAEPSERAAAA
jgi:pimeloyl-ACP methyl ester carboxylesterase